MQGINQARGPEPGAGAFSRGGEKPVWPALCGGGLVGV